MHAELGSMGIMNDGFAVGYMALTVPVISRFKATARITAVSSGKTLAYGQADGRLVIGEDEFELSSVTSIFEFTYGEIIVGTSNGLYMYKDGEESNFQEHPTGIEFISGNGNNAVAIDGMGRAHLVDSKNNTTLLDASSVLFAKVGEQVAIATESGHVYTYSLDGLMTWERPMRGDVGERITAIGWHGDVLTVAREGHGLVPGEEEALEIEYWVGTKLDRRFDVNRRVVSIDGPWMGLDMGGVMHGEELISELNHPAHIILDKGDHALVGSWFHLHRISKSGSEWSVETKGMVEHVSSNSNGSAVLIAGSDQNDYSDDEPAVLIDSTVEPVTLVEEDTAIDDWGDAPPIEISAEEIYGETTSIEELAGISQSELDDESGLLDALNDEIVHEEIVEEDDDLMLALSLDAEEIVAPTPDAGGDQSLAADAEGTAIVTLDGSGTLDPQDRVKSWSWVDYSGKEIADTPVVRVKLNQGNHRLELRIKDSDGRWSSDSIDVRIE